jgi:hypothetical protein
MSVRRSLGPDKGIGAGGRLVPPAGLPKAGMPGGVQKWVRVPE